MPFSTLPFFLSIALLPAAACASISAVDGRGKTITLPAPPRRIVSITPSNTEILFDLGLKGRIVADTSQCDYPPEARYLPHVGDYRISVEQVVAQNPDLVVAVTSANRGAIDQLEKLGIKVFAVDPYNLGDLYASIRAIGAITGTTPRADAIVADMRKRVDLLRTRVSRARTKPKVLVVVQSQPLMVAGSNNFLDEAVRLAGGINIGASAGSRFPLMSPEKAIVAAPDVILGSSEVARKPGWSAMPAVQRHAIFAPPADTLSRPTPRLIDGIEYIVRRLHPELFADRKPAEAAHIR